MSDSKRHMGADEKNIRVESDDLSFLIFVCAGLLIFLQVVAWLATRGGVFSVLSGILAAQRAHPVVDIDEDGLWFPFVVLGCAVAIGHYRTSDTRRARHARMREILPIVGIIIGGTVLSLMLGEPIITRYMSANGYIRCEAGDWAQGNRRSRTYFVDYVLKGVECRRRIETVPNGESSWGPNHELPQRL